MDVLPRQTVEYQSYLEGNKQQGRQHRESILGTEVERPIVTWWGRGRWGHYTWSREFVLGKCESKGDFG